MRSLRIERLVALAALVPCGCLKPTPGYLGPEGDDATATAGAAQPGEPCVPVQGGDSDLAVLAGSLAPGEWGELRTMNFVDSFLAVQAGWFAHDTNSGVWDPSRQQAYILGERFLRYDEQTNAWDEDPVPCDPCFQGEDQTTFDLTRSTLYHRGFGDNVVYRYDDGSRWQELPPIPTDFRECCDALEYFETRDELVFADNSGVFLFSIPTQQWSQPWGAVGLDDRNIIEYSNVNELMLMLGNGSLLTLDADAQIQDKAPSPVPLPPGDVLVTPDLVTGNFLVFVDPDAMYVYDAVADTWEARAGQPLFAAGRNPSVNDFVAVPIPTYCVTMFAVYDFDRSTVFLYRHGA